MSVLGIDPGWKLPSSFSRLKASRFPREIIAYAAWAHHCFALSTADMKDLLAELGVIVSREQSAFGSIAWVAILLIVFARTGQGRMTSGI